MHVFTMQLNFCIQEGGTPLMYAAYNGYPQVVKLLLGKQTSPNLREMRAITWFSQSQQRCHFLVQSDAVPS